MGLVLTAILVLQVTKIYAAEDVSPYLILNDIPPYQRLTQTKDTHTKKLRTIPGYTSYPGAGVLAGADHFIPDHSDMTFETTYQNDEIGISVEVTKHAGSDSDKWLLHEMEDGYRDGDNSNGKLGLLSGDGVKIRDIGGSKIIYWGLGGGNYTWLSGQNVVEIKYTDLQRTTPEPREVIQAYVLKHPSTISIILVLDKAHDVKWIKDEMDRRLWLCDKWFLQMTLKKADEKQVYQETVKSMNIFLEYREKYFSMKAADEKNLLSDYLSANNGTNIKAKLKEYKDWWSLNKEKSITLP